jgi:hypothetical protein
LSNSFFKKLFFGSVEMLEKAMTLLGASVVPLAGLVGETFPQKSFDLQPAPPPLGQLEKCF